MVVFTHGQGRGSTFFFRERANTEGQGSPERSTTFADHQEELRYPSEYQSGGRRNSAGAVREDVPNPTLCMYSSMCI